MADADHDTLQLLSGYLPSGWLKLRCRCDPETTAHKLEFNIQYGPKGQRRSKYCLVFIRSVEELLGKTMQANRIKMTPVQLAFILLDDIFGNVHTTNYTLAEVVAVTNNVLSSEAMAFLYSKWERCFRGTDDHWQAARRLLKLVARRAWAHEDSAVNNE